MEANRPRGREDRKLRKNYKLTKKQIFVPLIVFILLLGPNLSFGQRYFHMKEKEVYQKFKIANRFFLKGKEHFLKENYKKAEKELKKCIKELAEHVEAHFYLCQILYKKGDLHQALEHIEKAKENFEYMADLQEYAHLDYISQLREQMDILDENLSNLQGKLSKTQNYETRSVLESQISSIEQKKGTIKSKLTEPIPPVESIPSDYFYFHGNIFFKLKRYQEAHVQYLEAVKVNPQHGNAYNNLASLHFMAKQYQEALNYLDQAEASGAKVNPEFKKAILKALGK